MVDSQAAATIETAVPDLGTPEYEQFRLFLSMFDPQDAVLIRYLESWTEGGKKISRTVFRQSRCWRPANLTPRLFAGFLKIASQEKANLFFGVCPRFNLTGFDLSWQVRTVVCLWADLDHCTPEEALARCEKAGLPRPSCIVCSGHGVHVYWILSKPYLIDDVPDPPQVQRQFVVIGGKKRCLNYFTGPDGVRVDLNDPETGAPIRHAHPKLSAKAVLIQDVLKGLAAQIGGDHTTDLARLLRLPGTMNRKNERSGAEPVPCQLFEHSDTRYDFDIFAPLAEKSPDKKRREQIAKVALPSSRKLSPSRKDALNRLILMCETSEDRSKADFALCCYAIEKGVAPDVLWPMIETVGKFSERGRGYFDLTWDNAAAHTREKLFDAATNRGRSKRRTAPLEHDVVVDAPDGGSSDAPEGSTETADDSEVTVEHAPSQIVIMPEEIPVSAVMNAITQGMLRVGKYFRRAGIPVMIQGTEITAIDSTGQLCGIVNSFAEVVVVKAIGSADGDAEKREYKPLPTDYATTWLNHPSEVDRLPEIKLFTRNPVFDSEFRLLNQGYDPQSAIYFTGPAVAPRDGTEHLDAMLLDFCFRIPADRTNYIAMMLTSVLMNHFIGSKPGVIFNGNQPSLGKTILAQILAVVRDGRLVKTCTYTDKDDEFEKRIATRVRSGDTTLIIDNAKTRQFGKPVPIESACLERSITDEILSFRLLGQNEEIRAENSHIFAITVNSAELSRDLVTRCIPVELFFEGNPLRRPFRIANPATYAGDHRAEILGELLGMVELWKAAGRPLAVVESRFNKRNWGQIIGGILEVNKEPDFLQNAEQAACDFDPVRRDFEELVQILVDNPETKHWTASAMARVALANQLLVNDIGEQSERSKATRMGTLLGRFINESVRVTGRCGTLESERIAKLRVHDARNGREYWFEVSQGGGEG